jgi:hypothetical protein
MLVVQRQTLVACVWRVARAFALVLLLSLAPACTCAKDPLRVALLIIATDVSSLEGLWIDFFKGAAGVHPPNLAEAAKAELLEEGTRTQDVMSRLRAAGNISPVESIVKASCVDNRMLRVWLICCAASAVLHSQSPTILLKVA